MIQKEKDKYTLWESAAVFALTAVTIALVLVATFPILILTAWMRETVWNWYCGSFHLPPVTLWSMVVVGIFVGTFMPTSPSLKDDLLKFKSWQNALFLIFGQVFTFAMIAVIHIWFKGASQ